MRIDRKITQGQSVILLDLLVNGDGEGGGVFVQSGSLIKIERVGPLLYFDTPKKFWASHATAAQTNQDGGKWLAVLRPSRLQPLRQGALADGPARRHQPVLKTVGMAAGASCRTGAGGRTAAAHPGLLEEVAHDLGGTDTGGRTLRPRWSSGMYSPMTPASIAIGIDCSQIRPGPVSTAKWWPSAPCSGWPARGPSAPRR